MGVAWPRSNGDTLEVGGTREDRMNQAPLRTGATDYLMM